jgi:hypothetical protein
MAPSAVDIAPRIRVPIPRREWEMAWSRHTARFDAVVAPHVQRRSRHEEDPVADFLFEYYRFRPSHLRPWHPGTGVLLEGADPERFRDKDGYRTMDGGRILLPTPEVLGKNAAKFRSGTKWIYDLLTATQDRPARFGCFGLHEWAMLYRTDMTRHDSVPLRVGQGELADVVESVGLRCTHFDAFRFFTEPARPLNPVQLTRLGMAAHEQPGCLHANMDVYRWAFKRSPWIPSELVLDAFELALDIRTLDMAASPYDLRDYGLDPMPVETAEGREEFGRKQRAFSDRASVLRDRLITAYANLLDQMP